MPFVGNDEQDKRLEEALAAGIQNAISGLGNLLAPKSQTQSSTAGPRVFTTTSGPQQPTYGGSVAGGTTGGMTGGSTQQAAPTFGFSLADLFNIGKKPTIELAPSNTGSGNQAAVSGDPSQWTWYQAMAYAKQNYESGAWTPEQSVTVVNDLFKLRSTPGNRFYAPFAQGNQTTATDYLRGVKVDGQPLLGKGEELSPEWIGTHAWLMNFLKVSEAGNALGPTSNDKKNGRTPASNSAYYYNQLLNNGSVENSLRADAEWEQLQKDVAYWTGRRDLNLSDDDIIRKLNIEKNYPTLAKLRVDSEASAIALAAGLTPVKLAWGADYSEEAIYGLIWASRNGGYKDNGTMLDWMTGYYLGQGNQYVEDPAISARLIHGSPNYNPYAVSATMDKELRQEGVAFFPKDWCDTHEAYANDPDKKPLYDKVKSAEEFTSTAEDQYAKLMAEVDKWISKGKKEEWILNELDKKLQESDYNALRRIDSSLEPSDDNLIATTRPIGYSKNDVMAYIHDRCEGKAEADMEGRVETVQVAEDLTGETMPAGPTNKEVDAAKEAVGVVLGDNGTPMEQTTAALADETFDGNVNFFTSFAAAIKDYNDARYKTAEQAVKGLFTKNSKFIETTAPAAQYRAWEQQKAKLIEALKTKWNINYTEDVSTSLSETPWGRMSDAQKITIAEGLFPAEKVENQEDTYRLFETNPDGSKTDITEKITGRETINGEYLIGMVQDAELFGSTWNGLQLPVLIRLFKADIPDMTSDKAKEIFGMYADIFECDNQMNLLRVNDETLAMYDDAVEKLNELVDAQSMITGVSDDAGYLWADAMDMIYSLSVYDPTSWLPFDDYTYYINKGIENAKEKGTFTPGLETLLGNQAQASAAQNEALYEATMKRMEDCLEFLKAAGVTIPDDYIKNYNRKIAELQRGRDQCKYFLKGYEKDFKEKSDKFNWIENHGVDSYGDCLWRLGEFMPSIRDPLGAPISQRDMLALLDSDRTDEDGYTALDYLVMSSAYIPEDTQQANNFFRQWAVGDGSRYLNLELMTDAERERYYYIRETEGFKAAKKYIDTLIDPTYGVIVTRSAQESQKMTEGIAGSGFWGGLGMTIGSFATSQMQIMGLGYMIAQRIKGDEMNPNSPWWGASRFTTTVRSTVSKNIKGDGKNGWRNLLDVFYNGGTSVIDSGITYGITKIFAPWIGNIYKAAEGMVMPGTQKLVEGIANFLGAIPMAVGAGATSAWSTKLNRGSDEQAWGMFWSTGFWESITEAIEIDIFRKTKASARNFLSSGGWKTAEGWRGFLTDMGWATAVELTGEVLNQAGETFDENRILKDKAQFWLDRDIAARIYGMSPVAANAYAWVNVIKGAVNAGATGGVAGLFSFLGGMGANTIRLSQLEQATNGQSVIDEYCAEMKTGAIRMGKMLDWINRLEKNIATRTAQNGTENGRSQAANARDTAKIVSLRQMIQDLQAEMADMRKNVLPIIAARVGVDVRTIEEGFHFNDLMTALDAAAKAEADYKANPTERNRSAMNDAFARRRHAQQDAARWVQENGPMSQDTSAVLYERSGEWYGDPSVPESERGRQAQPQEAPATNEEAAQEEALPVVGVTPGGVEAHSQDELRNALAEELGAELDALTARRSGMTDEEYYAALEELARKYDADHATRTGMTPGGRVLTGEQLTEALHNEYEQALKDLEASMHGKGPHMSMKQYRKAQEKIARTYSEENAFNRKAERDAEAERLNEERAKREAEIAEAEAKRAAQAEEEEKKAAEAQKAEEESKAAESLTDSNGQSIPGDAIGVTPGGQYASNPKALYEALNAEKAQALERLADMEKRGLISKGLANALRENYGRTFSYESARARMVMNQMVAEARKNGTAAHEKNGPYFIDPSQENTPEMYRMGLIAALTDLDFLQTMNRAQVEKSTPMFIRGSMLLRRMNATTRNLDMSAYGLLSGETTSEFMKSMNSMRILGMLDDVMPIAYQVLNDGAENADTDLLNRFFGEVKTLRDMYVENIAKNGLLTTDDMANMTLTEALRAESEARIKAAQEEQERQQTPAQPAPRDENGFDVSDPVITQNAPANENVPENPPAKEVEGQQNPIGTTDIPGPEGNNQQNPNAPTDIPAQEGEGQKPNAPANEVTTDLPGRENVESPNAPTDIPEQEGQQNPIGTADIPGPEAQQNQNEPTDIPEPESQQNTNEPTDIPDREGEGRQDPNAPSDENPEQPKPEDVTPPENPPSDENEPTTTTDAEDIAAKMKLLVDGLQTAGESTNAALIASMLRDSGRGELDPDMAAAAAMNLANIFGDAQTAAKVVQGATSVASNLNNVQLAFQIGSLYSGGLSEQALRALTPTPSASAVDNLVKAAYLDSKNADYGPKIGEALRDYNVAREMQNVAQQNPQLVNNVRNAQQAYDAAVSNERDARQNLEQVQQEMTQLQNQLVSAGAQMASDSGGASGTTNAAMLATAAGDVVAKARQVTEYQQAYANARARTQTAGAQLAMAANNIYAEAKQAAQQSVIQKTADRATQKLAERTARAQADAEQVRQQEEANRQAENEQDGRNLDEMDWNEYARRYGKDVNDETQRQRFLEKARQNRENKAAANPAQQTAPGEMTDAKKQLVEKVAQSYGIQVKWVDSILEGKANGAFDGGNTIYLSKSIKSDQALQQIFFHELTHSTEGTRAYRNLIAMTIDLAFDGNVQRYNQFVDRRMEAYNNILRGLGKKEITRQQAARELVADLMPQILFADQEQADRFAERRPTMIGYLVQSLKEFIAKLRGVQTEGKAQLMRAQLTYERALQKAERARQKRMDESTHPLSELFHIETLMEASDLIPVRDASGQVIYLADLNGNRVNEITAENMENSPMGRLTRTAVKNGTLTEEGRDSIMKTMASLATLIMKVNDVGSVWEITGAFFTSPTQVLPWEWTGDPTFSAVKSNSDPQYSSTIDFGTVCARTQQLIDVLSQTMVAEGRGLTRNEVLRAYQMVATEHVTEEYAKAHPEMLDENGNPKRLQITCPVCYVFSRWIGVPSLLNTIGQYQRQFLNMTDQELTDWVNNTQSRFLDDKGVFDKDKLDSEKTKLKNKLNKLLENVDDYMRTHRMSENLESDPEFNDLMDRMEKAQADFDALNAYAYVTQVALEWARKGNETYLVAYDQNGKRVSKPGPNTLYHRDQSVKIVPNEILFDMNRGGDFARLYPKTWSFRTTRGAGMGKAVMPFGGWRIGDVVYGAQTGGARVGATRTRVNPLTGETEQVQLADRKDNYFLRNANGRYVYENRMREALKNAARRQRAQNLIGGQRLQSTSDFRAEWGLDYVLAMMELQALGSKTQMYTKVLDAVPFLASMGNEVNMSAMSNGLGYRTNADGTQELALSSITGVDPEMGYRFQHMYDNAQMILVGLNDTHIRLALRNSEDLNNDIMFVIPWHSSGNSIAMLDMMMNAIGAEGTSAHQDYTNYENDEDVQGFIDKVLKGEYKAYTENGGTMTRGEYYADRLGKLGFTEFGFNVKGAVEEGGLDRLAELVDSKADFKVVPTPLQQARRDARYKIVNGTYMAKGDDRKPFTAADMAAIESSKYLQRLYDRFCVDKNSDAYQVSFASKTAEKIFPHEYWDKSADYWHARVNGDNFVEYCRELGLVPRFSQFTDEDGYWKLLIDRRMFDRQGNYREQGYVDVTEAATKMLPMTVNEATYADTEATARAVEHVRFGRENADGTFTPSAVADWNTVLDRMSFSLQLDEDYMNAVQNGDMETAQRLVDEAAKAAGYTYRAYHGTPAKFTTFKPGMRGEMWFSSTRETSYKDRGQVYDTYLKMNNPYESTSYYGENDFDPTKVTEEGRHNGHDGAITHFTTDPKYVERNRGLFKSDIKATDKFGDNFMFLPKGEIRASLAKDGETLMDFMERTSQEGLYDWYTVYNPNQIKSAEPVVYDNAGNVIPLSERFNDQSNDIRYSLDLAEARDNLQAMLDPEQANLEDVSTDTGDVIDDAEFHIGTGEEQYIQNGILNDQAFEDELMDSWIQNPNGRQPIALGTNADRSFASYSRSADQNASNDNKDHERHMRSPQQIAKRLARNLNIGAAIGTRNMAGMSSATRGYYTFRVRAMGIRPTSANSFITGMHELGHGVSDRISTLGTPEMVAKLPPAFAASYRADELPYEAFAEFFWQYMTQDNKAVPFAGQAFVNEVEQKMKDAGIWNDVQKARDELMLWIEGSTSDRIGSVIHDRSEGQRMPIKDWFRSMVDQVTDATYAAERVISRIREQTGQKRLPFAVDLRQNARMKNFAARQAFNLLTKNLTDANGTIISDALGKRFKAAGFKATDQNIDLLVRYMLALHSLYRDAEGKPVFDEHITTKARQDFIERVQNEHPEIRRAEEAFQDYRREFLHAWMVDTGFMSQEAFDLFEQKYPHYVPTLRVKDARYHDQNQQGGKHYTIRRAKGSTEDIWNPIDSFVGMVNSIVGMVSTNRTALAWERAYRNYDGMGIFGREITEDIEATQVDLSELSRKIENILDTEVEEDVLQDVLDLMAEGMTQFRRTNNTTMPNGIMVQHADGTRSFFEIFDTELYKLLASVQENTHNQIFESIGRLTHMMAGLTTGSNPIFAARNFMRDFQTSVNYGSWASNYATGMVKWLRAAYEVWTRSGEWADYEALGGGGWTRIQADTKQGANEYRQGIFQKGYNTRNVGATARFLGQKLWNTLSFARLNEIVEQTSRYAEYRFGKHDKSTPEGRMEAFLAAQDVTVDFARKGNGAVAQTLKQLIPFFGASMQGVARTARTFTESERERTPIRFLKTVVNTALLSALASLLLLRHTDDDEKEEFVRMSDSLKSMHFYFPNFAPQILGEAPLIRIPVGQDPLMYAIHGAVTDAIWNGIGDGPAIDAATIASTILDVCNPFGNGTIFEAALDVMQNETYYGSRIIPASLDNQDPSNQYSDDTPDVFIGLGRMLGVSPNVVQYLAEQYTGFLGQIAIPAMSKTEGGNLGGYEAVRDAIRRKFTTDPLTSNDVLDSFYDARTFLNAVKAAGDSGRPMNMLRRGLDELDAEDAYDEAVSLLSTKGAVGKTAKQITKYYAQISEILADNTMSPHEKAEEIKKIRREMIEMVLDAQEEIGEYKAQYFTGYDPIFDRFLPGTKIEPKKE